MVEIIFYCLTMASLTKEDMLVLPRPMRQFTEGSDWSGCGVHANLIGSNSVRLSAHGAGRVALSWRSKIAKAETSLTGGSLVLLEPPTA